MEGQTDNRYSRDKRIDELDRRLRRLEPKDVDEPGPCYEPGQPMSCEATRPTAKSILRLQADNLRRQADHIEALLKALPEELPPEADEALWKLSRGFFIR